MQKIEYVHFGVVITRETTLDLHRLVATQGNEPAVIGEWASVESNCEVVHNGNRFETRNKELFCLIPVSLRPPEKKKK